MEELLQNKQNICFAGNIQLHLAIEPGQTVHEARETPGLPQRHKGLDELEISYSCA